MNPGPTPDERIDAIEKFLAQLVLLLEVEPDVNRETIGSWLHVCSAAARAHRAQTPRQQAVFKQLCERVLSLDEDTKPDAAALQALRSAMQRMNRPSLGA